MELERGGVFHLEGWLAKVKVLAALMKAENGSPHSVRQLHTDTTLTPFSPVFPIPYF